MWIKDEDFIRGEVPMTKFAIRTLIVAALEPGKEEKILDIGAGTGSISVELATFGCDVVSIDFEEKAVELISKNAEKHGVELKIIRGMAPSDLPREIFDKCFIGGSSGNLEDIFGYLESGLRRGGILAASFITLKNLNEFKELLKKHGYKKCETTLVQVSNESSAGLLMGQNPVFIVKGIKS